MTLTSWLFGMDRENFSTTFMKLVDKFTGKESQLQANLS